MPALFVGVTLGMLVAALSEIQLVSVVIRREILRGFFPAHAGRRRRLEPRSSPQDRMRVSDSFKKYIILYARLKSVYQLVIFLWITIQIILRLCLLLSFKESFFFDLAGLWLSRIFPVVLRDAVGVLAGCKGVEIALAMASYLPRVKATVCINGAITMTANSLQYGDIYMEGIPYHDERVLVSNTGAFQMNCAVPNPRKPEHEAFIPPLEKAKGLILFLVGEDDTMLDSVSCAKAAKDRAERFGKKDISVLSFPGAGHLIEPPGSPLCTVTRSPYFTRPLLFGGEVIPHCAAQETCWRERQDFFRINIAGPSRQSKL